MRKYRVIQWGTGQVGTHSLRGVLNHPQLELVGLCVHSSSDEGRDAGDFVGRAPTGIVSTRDADALLALDAECVCYSATDSAREDEVVEEFVRILEAGKNVATSAMASLTYPPMVPTLTSRLDAACDSGGASFHCGGINPGFVTDVLTLAVTSLCDRIESVSAAGHIDTSAYVRDPATMAGLGQGRTLDEFGEGAGARSMIAKFWTPIINHIADGLAVELEEITEFVTPCVTDHQLETASGPIPPGTICALNIGVVGKGGDTTIRYQEWMRFAPDGERYLPSDWPIPPGGWSKGGYRVEIKGSPNLSFELALGDGSGSTAIMADALIATAMRVVNLVPRICDAVPGVQTAQSLGYVAGGRAPAGAEVSPS